MDYTSTKVCLTIIYMIILKYLHYKDFGNEVGLSEDCMKTEYFYLFPTR